MLWYINRCSTFCSFRPYAASYHTKTIRWDCSNWYYLEQFAVDRTASWFFSGSDQPKSSNLKIQMLLRSFKKEKGDLGGWRTEKKQKSFFIHFECHAKQIVGYSCLDLRFVFPAKPHQLVLQKNELFVQKPFPKLFVRVCTSLSLLCLLKVILCILWSKQITLMLRILLLMLVGVSGVNLNAFI